MTPAEPTRASFLATYKRLLGYLRPHRWIAAMAVTGMVFDATCTSVFMHLIKPMLNDLFIKQDPKTILWLPLAIVLLFLIRGSATYATDFGMAQIGRGVVQALRSQVFARYLRLPAAYFDREPSGQQISRLEALRLYTEGAAWFSFDDHHLGSFTEGKYADLSVLSHDYLAVPDDVLRRIESVLTLVGGRIVHAAAPFESLRPQP